MPDSANGSANPAVPPEPIDHVLSPIVRFMHVEAASGIILLLATVVALVLANSPAADAFLGFWQIDLSLRVGTFEFRHSLQHLINDGLMTIFFYLVGMEVKREMVLGELRQWRHAALPIAAAIGGMVVPAAIYLSMQWGQPAHSGWGIPMATDIAFVVGCMAVLGRRVSRGLRVMLLTLAIADDIGAILIIALGYSGGLHWAWLGWAASALLLVLLMQRVGIRSPAAYALVGIVTWFAVLESGIHATIAGVVLGLLTRAHPRLEPSVLSRLASRARATIEGTDDAKAAGGSGNPTNPHRAGRIRRLRDLSRQTLSPLEYLIHVLHPWVSFVIMPLFALANAGVPFHTRDLGAPVALAILLALVIGKPLGILLTSLLAVKSGIAQLPDGTTWPRLCGGGLLCGIGFTMALFIAGLALRDATLDIAKVGVLAGSLVSAVLGMLLLLLLPAPPGASQQA